MKRRTKILVTATYALGIAFTLWMAWLGERGWDLVIDAWLVPGFCAGVIASWFVAHE